MDKFTLPTYKASYGFSLLLLGVVCSNVTVAIYIRMYSVIKTSVTFLKGVRVFPWNMGQYVTYNSARDLM